MHSIGRSLSRVGLTLSNRGWLKVSTYLFLNYCSGWSNFRT